MAQKREVIALPAMGRVIGAGRARPVGIGFLKEGSLQEGEKLVLCQLLLCPGGIDYKGSWACRENEGDTSSERVGDYKIYTIVISGNELPVLREHYEHTVSGLSEQREAYWAGF